MIKQILFLIILLFPNLGFSNVQESNQLMCQLGFNFACEKKACVNKVSSGEVSECIDLVGFSDCRACEYYRCKEKEYECGEDGYLLGYVGKYCDRFSNITMEKTSVKAQAWLKQVRECLINEFERSTDLSMSCAEIHKIGTDSHAKCYVDSGFCDLSVKDWFDIVHTIDPGDIPFRQLIVTGNKCLKNWFNF